MTMREPAETGSMADSDPPAEGGDGGLKTNGDAAMVDGPPETPSRVHPVDTGREEETTRGAFMVVGTMEEARKKPGQHGRARRRRGKNRIGRRTLEHRDT